MTGDRMFLFLAIAHRLLRGAERPVILVDWTQACGTHVALVAAVPIDGRALPIYVGSSPAQEARECRGREAIPSSLKAIVPPECRASSCLTQASRGRSFPPSSNVAGISWAASEARPRPSLPPARRSRRKSFTPEHRPLPSSWEHLVFREAPDSLPPRARSKATSTGAETPASSLQGRARAPPVGPRPLAARDVTVRRRCCRHRPAVRQTYAIEETFRDAKSHRFGWSLGSVRLSTLPERPSSSRWLLWPTSSSHSSEWPSSAPAAIALTKPTPRRDASFPSWSWLRPSCAEQKSSALSPTFVSLSPRSHPSSSYDFSRGSLRGWGEGKPCERSRADHCVGRGATPSIRGGDRCSRLGTRPGRSMSWSLSAKRTGWAPSPTCAGSRDRGAARISRGHRWRRCCLPAAFATCGSRNSGAGAAARATRRRRRGEWRRSPPTPITCEAPNFVPGSIGSCKY